MAQENKAASKQPKPLLMVSIVLLCVLMLGSAIFFIVLRHNVPNTTLATPPAKAKLSPTALVSPSLTPQPLFSDTFIDNTKGWYTGNVPGYIRIVSGSLLTLSDTNHKVLTESLPTNQTFSDFLLTTTFSLVDADDHDSVGVYLRGDSNLDHDYRVEVFGNNTYAISKESLDGTNTQHLTYLVGPQHSSLLHPKGQVNVFTLMMRGNQLELMINGNVANSLTDTDYTHGQIALFVANGDTSSGVTASFSSIAVYPLLNQPPT